MYEDSAFLLLPHTRPVSSASHSEPSYEQTSVVYDPLRPPPLTGMSRLVGRDSLFQQLKQQVLTERSLALYGLPGVGKTALAVALSYDQDICAQFSDGVLWAGLGLQPYVSGLLRRWGMLLGITIREEEKKDRQNAWIQALQAIIATHCFLLVFDDVWQVEDFEALRVSSTRCGYLLTTRFAHIAMHLSGERAMHIPELEEAAGVQLLTRFVPEILPHERATALALVNAVGGHPLSLTLMSKYLGSNALMGQPRRLRAALDQLHNVEQRLRLHMPQAAHERPLTIPDGIEVSVRSVIAVSDLHLPLPARHALRCLSVLPAKPTYLTQEVVLAVADTTVEVLAMLCDAGLVEHINAQHYMLHPLIIDYVRTQDPEREASLRLIRYGVDFIEAHYADARVLERESTIILTALDQAWEAECWAELIRGYALLVPLLFRWGWYTLAEQLLQRNSLAVARAGSAHDKVQSLENLSVLDHLQGNYDRATAFAHEGLTMARQIDNQEKVICLLTALGGSTHEQGDYTQAEMYYQEALVLARQQDKYERIATLLKNLGVLAKKRGNYLQAQTYYQEGLDLARQLDNHDLVSLLLTNLGVVATERGDYSLAQTYYQDALALARQWGYRENTCILLSNLGVIADAQGDYARAQALFSEGLALAREIGHRERISLLLLNLGVIADRQGKDSEAEAFYQEGLALARELGHRERISLLLLNLGDIVMEQGQEAQAEAYFQEGLALARELGHRERISDLLQHLAMLAIRQGELVLAGRYLQEGLALARQLEHPQLICRQLAAWGEFHLQQQNVEAAEYDFLEMLDLVPAGSRAIYAQAQYGLACVAMQLGQFSRAKALAAQSYATFELLGHRKKSLVHAFVEHLATLPES